MRKLGIVAGRCKHVTAVREWRKGFERFRHDLGMEVLFVKGETTTHHLAAARIVLSQRDDVSFLVVGSGSLIDELSSKVEHEGISQRFVFTGQRSDVPLVLSACDLFVLPSLFEGLCMAVLEAFAAGVPVVATKVGGVPSTVVEGETGALVPPGDVEALAEAIIWMLGNPELARKMGLRGKRRVEKRFTIDAMIKRTEAVYELLLSRRKNQMG